MKLLWGESEMKSAHDFGKEENLPEKRNAAGLWLAALCGILWATIGIFVKEMSALGAAPLNISFIRLSFAFFLMLGVTILRSGAGALRISPRAAASGALMGIVGHGLFNMCYCSAIAYAGVAIAVALLYLAPAVTLVSSAVIFGEKLSGRKMAAVAINILGCVLAATGGSLDLKGASLIGIFCGIGAGLFYGLHAILGRIASSDADPFISSTVGYAAAAVFLGAVVRPWQISWGAETPRLLFIGFLFALIPTSIAYCIYYKALTMVTETSRVAVAASLEPAIAAMIGYYLYHEDLNTARIAGIILVLVSILIMNSGRRASSPSGRP